MNDTLNKPSLVHDRQDAQLSILRALCADLGDLLRATEAVIKAREADLQSQPTCSLCGAKAELTVDGHGAFCVKCL